MSQAFDLLVAEIDRVVSSPYPTQLKVRTPSLPPHLAPSAKELQQLHIIACQRCTDQDFAQWAAARPCQTDVLAQNLLEALQQWPYVLEIITKICCAVGVRDALLRYEPTLLFDVVSQAVNGSWKHNAASIALLSHPIPVNVTLPAATQNLFLGIVDHAAQAPSSASVRPVYQLLKGGLAPLLGLLSNEVLTQVERHFLDILRNTIGQADQKLSLYCLVVMRCMIMAANEDMSFSASYYETQELLTSMPNSPKWKPKGMHQYFTDSKAHKTLHLIVLRVLWAANISNEKSVDELDECLGVANELITFLPEDLRREWCSQNPIVVRKLQEKVCQPELDAKVQIQAFAFVCNLCASRDQPDAITTRLSALLQHPGNLFMAIASGETPAMHTFAELMTSSQVAELLMAWTAFALEAKPSDIISCSATLVLSIGSLVPLLERSEDLSAGVLGSLSSSAVAHSLSQLPATMITNTDRHATSETGICHTALTQSRKAIINSISSLYLRAALVADHTQTEVASDVYPLLINIHSLSASDKTKCGHVRPRARLPPKEESFASQPSATVETDWRRALDQHLQTRAQDEHAAISEVFANACADLETRCNEVEMPLKREQRARKDLQSQYDDLSRAYTDLEDERTRLVRSNEGLIQERADHLHDLATERAETGDLLVRVTELEEALRLASAEASEHLAAVRNERDRAEMEHATALAKTEERVEDLENKLAGARGDLQFERQYRADLQQALDGATSRADTHQEERMMWQTTEDESRQKVARVEQAKEELSARCTALLSDLEGLRQDLNRERDAHLSHVGEIEQENERQMAALTNEHAQRLKTLQDQQQSDRRFAEDALATSRNESRQAQEDFSTQLSKRDKKLADCVAKVSKHRTRLGSETMLTQCRLSISRRSVLKRTSRSRKPTQCVLISWLPWVWAT